MSIRNSAGTILTKAQLLALMDTVTQPAVYTLQSGNTIYKHSTTPGSKTFEDGKQLQFRPGQTITAAEIDALYPTSAVTSITPASGKSTGGTAVTIRGTNFAGASGATIGGVAVTSFVLVNDTTITAVTGAHAAGAVDVVVTDDAGNSTLAGGFTYILPTISSLSPNTGPAAGGTPITITGTGFTGATGVTLGGVAVTSFVVVSNTSITCVSGAHAAGAVDVVITNPTNGNVTSVGGYTYS